MKNKHIFTARCLSCITALTLAFSSFPDTHVFAEVEVLESAEDIPNVAEVPAIYIVTEFPEFKKNPDGTYTDSTIQQTYGSLSAVSGTAADDLGLPDDLTISGYWEVNGPEVPAEQFVLTDISWKLKSATGETYSEATPAGEYTFVPDLNAYVASQQAMGNTTFDEIKMEENVSLLELKVTITAEAPEETAPTGDEPQLVDGTVPSESDSQFVDGTVPSESDSQFVDGTTVPSESDSQFVDGTTIPSESDSQFVDGTVPSESDSQFVDGTTVPSESDSLFVDGTTVPSESDSQFVDGTTVPSESDSQFVDGTVSSESDSLQTDYISNTDDSLINADGSVFINDTPIPETTDSSVIVSESESVSQSESISESESVSQSESLSESESISESESASQSEPVLQSVPETEPDSLGSSDGIITINTTESDTPDSLNNPASSVTTTATTEEPPSSDTAASDSTVSTDSTAASDSTASTDSTAVSESTLQVPADLTVNFTVSDSVNIYSDETTSDTVTLKYQPGEGDNSAVIQVPCYADLSNLTVSFTDAYDGSPITAIPEEAQDFSNGNTVEFTLSSISADTSVPAEYTLKFSVVPEEHVWHEADCTNPQYCENCGATQGSALGHSYSAATCTEPEICSRCGATGKAALGHDWKAATCTTPETCRRCGEMVGEPLGHNWQAATCTVPKTCKRCGATEGNALGHDMRDDWRVVNNSTATTHGQENRTCHRDGCSYTESRPLNIIGDPSGNGISGIAEGQNYNLKTVLTFTAYGAGMSNTEPINGDVRYVPSTWSIQNTPGTFRDNFTGSFSISMSGRYTLTVTYQKQIYSDGWQVSDIADSKSVSFTVGNVIQANPVDGTANGIKINPQTGDSTPIIAFVIALAAAALVLAGVLIYKKKRK